MQRLQRFTLILTLCLLALTACQTQNQPDTIRIGYVGPLSGPAAEYGTDEQTAISIAVDEINANGGVNGKNISIVYEDGKCQGKAAATAARKLINTYNVEAILGGACSGETLAIKPIAERTETVLISAFSTDPTITQGVNYTFRAGVNDKQGGRELARMVREHHDEVAILTENTDYARSIEQIFIQKFEAMNGTVYSQHYAQGASDFRSQLTKIRNQGVDAIVFNPQSGTTGGQAMKQARQLGFDQPFYGTFFVSGNAFQKIYGNRTPVSFIDAPTISRDDERAATFLTKFKRRAGRDPSNVFLAAARYDTTHLLANAIEAVGYNGPAIKEYLYNVTYDGILDTYRFSDQGEAKGIQYVQYRYVNGTVQQMKEDA